MGNVKETIKSIFRKIEGEKERAFLQTATTMHTAEMYSEEEKEKVLQMARMLDEKTGNCC